MIMSLKRTIGIVVIVMLFELVSSQECRCRVSHFQRTPCSNLSADISEEDCRAANCCYDSTSYLLYQPVRCFQPRVCPCEIPANERVSCGSYDWYSCRIRNCCYDRLRSPSCYRRIGGENSNRFNQRSPTPFYDEWSSWSDCSSTCTRGTQTRRRNCYNNGSEVSSTQCSGPNEEIKKCNTELCGLWSNWTDSGNCFGRCGQIGRMQITRTCKDLGSVKSRSCFLSFRNCSNYTNYNCPKAEWGAWQSWSKECPRCSFGGERRRERHCILNGTPVSLRTCIPSQQFFTASLILQASQQVEVCDLHACRVWSNWTEFEKCNSTCVALGEVSERVLRRHCLSQVNQRSRNNSKENDPEICTLKRETCHVGACSTAITNKIISTTSIPQVETAVQVTAAEETALTVSTTMSRNLSTESATPQTLNVTNNLLRQNRLLFNLPQLIWSRWTRCTQSCGPGISTRILVCYTTKRKISRDLQECNSELNSFEQKICNSDLCSEWSNWIENECVKNCSEENRNERGYRTRSRSCLTQAQTQAAPECSLSISSCTASVDNCITSTTATSAKETTHENVTESASNNTFSAVTSGISSAIEKSESMILSTSEEIFNTGFDQQEVTTASFRNDLDYNSKPENGRLQPAFLTSKITETTTPQVSVWRPWGNWSSCSESCGRGERLRYRTCVSPAQCQGLEGQTQTEVCNANYCQNWSSWSSSCSSRCGTGNIVTERYCLESETFTIPDECVMKNMNETCNETACDENLDILFLIDSSTYVDNCQQLKNQNLSIPILSANIDNQTTPVYLKVKEFIRKFVEDWKVVSNHKTRVAIQLMSGACSSTTGRNHNLQKSFKQSQENFVMNYVEPLPYLCGGFYLDLALSCVNRRTFASSSGDRSRTPNVVVALISNAPSYVLPRGFVLRIATSQLRRTGTKIIGAQITPSDQIQSVSSARKYEEFVRAVSCSRQQNCPTFIGSIWDEDNGTPAERIRLALQ